MHPGFHDRFISPVPISNLKSPFTKNCSSISIKDGSHIIRYYTEHDSGYMLFRNARKSGVSVRIKASCFNDDGEETESSLIFTRAPKISFGSSEGSSHRNEFAKKGGVYGEVLPILKEHW